MPAGLTFVPLPPWGKMRGHDRENLEVVVVRGCCWAEEILRNPTRWIDTVVGG